MGNRRPHGLPHPADDLGISTRKTVRHHRAMQNEQHTVIPRRLLQSLKDAVDHRVEAPLVDRPSGNRVEEVNGIEFKAVFFGARDHSSGVLVGFRVCFQPFLPIPRQRVLSFEVGERGFGQVEAVRLVADAGNGDARRGVARSQP